MICQRPLLDIGERNDVVALQTIELALKYPDIVCPLLCVGPRGCAHAEWFSY